MRSFRSRLCTDAISSTSTSRTASRHERLTRICFNDYDREIALVAEHEDPATSERQIVGVARLSKSRTANEAEFAVLVADGTSGTASAPSFCAGSCR